MKVTDRDLLERRIEEFTVAGDLSLDALEIDYASVSRIAVHGEVILPSDLPLIRQMAWFTRGLILHRQALLTLSTKFEK